MSGKNIKLGDKKINKSTLYKSKTIFNDIDDNDVNKILISKKESYCRKSSFKYFIGYSDNDDIKPLCVKLPQMIDYVKHFDGNMTMSFKIIDSKLLKKYTKIWKKN